ncbi:MAG: Septum formation [Actinomycetota bacterium]|jgi:hypothetical protein
MAIKKRYLIGTAVLLAFAGLLSLRSAMTTTIVDRQKSDKAPVHFRNFEVGECVLVPPTAVDTSDLVRTDCNLEHDAEIFAIKRPQDKKPTMPKSTQRLLDSFCNTSFKTYANNSPDAKNFDIWAAYGETPDFQQGATTVICFASLTSGDTMKTSIRADIKG